ncbi:MFP transporter [Archaeoglobales archaeon]|nr:MAG: MFP transporter [Archaeoglobales archaeon]
MFRKSLYYISKFIARRPGLVVSLIAIVVILSAISAQNVSLTSGTEDMFSKGNVIYREYKLYQKDFGVGANQLFVLVKGDDVVNREVYSYMLELQSEINRIDGVSSSVSPATIMVELFKMLPTDEALIKRATELYASSLVPKRTFALIIIQLATSDRDKQVQIAKEVEKVIKFSSPPVGVFVELTGSPALRYQIREEIRNSFRTTMTASTGLMVLILFATFSGVVRKKYTAFMPLVISILSVQTVYGLMPILGIPLSEHTNGALPMLIGLGIEYGAQLQNRYEEERRAGRDPDESIVISVTRTGLAIVMALVTTVIGFMSMLTPRIPAMSQFGIIASLGLIFAYIFTLTFLPAILKLIDREEKKVKVEEKPGMLEKSLTVVSSIAASKPFGILVFAAIIMVLGAYSYMNVELETNYHKYVPQDLPAMQRFDEIERLIGGQTVYTIVLSSDKIDSDTLRKVDELAEYIVSKEELVYDYNFITKLIKEFRKAYGLSPTIPESEQEVNYILDRLPKSETKRYISGKMMAIHFSTDADEYVEYISLYDSLSKDVSYFGWDGKFYITGVPVLYGEMGKIMMSGQTIMTVAAYFFVILLLLFVYRSLRKAVVPLIAISTVIATMNVIMYFFGIKQTMMSIALNSITLGLGIDFSIHMMERYFEERERFDPMTSVRRTIERTGKAISTSALTMAGAFGSLMFSSFPIVQNLGFIALIAIIFSLFAALAVVPSFLMVTERFSGQKFYFR